MKLYVIRRSWNTYTWEHLVPALKTWCAFIVTKSFIFLIYLVFQCAKLTKKKKRLSVLKHLTGRLIKSWHIAVQRHWKLQLFYNFGSFYLLCKKDASKTKTDSWTTTDSNSRVCLTCDPWSRVRHLDTFSKTFEAVTLACLHTVWLCSLFEWQQSKVRGHRSDGTLISLDRLKQERETQCWC